jgi:hypothetical protein
MSIPSESATIYSENHHFFERRFGVGNVEAPTQNTNWRQIHDENLSRRNVGNFPAHDRIYIDF